MIFTVDSPVQDWEFITAVQLAAFHGAGLNVAAQLPNAPGMLEYCAALPNVGGDAVALAFDRAFRVIQDSPRSYLDVLAEASGIEPGCKWPELPTPAPSPFAPSIVLAPHGIDRSLDLPPNVWSAFVKLLRTYGRVMLAGGRLDYASFTEGEHVLARHWHSVVQSSPIVIGVPNVTTMAAAAMGCRVVLYYPENIPPERWYWSDTPKVIRHVYDPYGLQVPVLLAFIRDELRGL